MFVIGIDGGGTKTRIELRDQENRLLERKIYGAFNVNSIGEPAFRALLREIFDRNMGDCLGICIGAAGVSNPRVGEILREVLDEKGYRGPWKLCGDQEIALRGAMDTPGIAVIAGTGSICFGRNAAGDTGRSGGYGHLIDDFGSGYALGRDALALCVRTADGREQAEALKDQVFAALNIRTVEELVAFVYSPETKKSHVAALASVVLKLAEAGDSYGLEILRKEAEEIALMVKAVEKKLSLEGCPIALLGGLFSSCNPYSRIAAEKLSALGTVMMPRHDALWGAAQMAWELTRA